MIVSTIDLAKYRGKVAMVDGGFDPIHPGHVDYFREASNLEAPVLCNISGDEWVSRKHPPLLSQKERGQIIDALRWIDYTHLSGTTTVLVLSDLRPRYYVKGADWEGRLPREEVNVCRENDVEIVYLDTIIDSSTAILERYNARLSRGAA